MSYINNVEFTTDGDTEFELHEFTNKLQILNNFFPFNEIIGDYDAQRGMNILLDNHTVIMGTFIESPYIVRLINNNKTAEIDIHPFDEMGGFDVAKFTKDLSELFYLEKLPSRIKYYLLDWKDQNLETFCTTYHNRKLMELSKTELHELFIFTTQNDIKNSFL